MGNESNKNGSKKTSTLVFLLSVLVILFAGMWVNEKWDLKIPFFPKSKDEFVNNANDQLDSIANQLNLKLVEIKKLGGRVNELEIAKQQILGDQQELENNPSLNEEDFKRKLTYYLRLLGQKELEIKRLRKENVALIARNDSLSREAKILQDGLSNVQKALKDSSVTFGVKQRELNERSRILEVKNKELVDKVNVAAALRAEGVNVYAISSRGKEVGVQNQKARKIDKIRVMFHLQDNSLATKEIKTVYLRIIEPTGNTLSDYALGSGIFSFKGRDLAYTAKQRIFYENNHQSVEFIYARPNAYREGKHEIELYSEGFLIGLGTFDVH
jgi:uncharacterized protein (DUF3084 family)